MLRSIENSAIVDGGFIHVATALIRGSVVLEWAESQDSDGNLITNQFCFPRPRQDLRSIIDQKEYAVGTVWECKIEHVCPIRKSGKIMMRTVIIGDVNETPVQIVRPHIGPWEIGQELMIAVCGDSKIPNKLILKPSNDEYLSFFNLSPQDQEKLQASKPNDVWLVRVDGGAFGGINYAGKRMLCLNCSLIGELPVRRRLVGDFYSGDEILVRVTTVNGRPEISGCRHGTREMVFRVDSHASDYSRFTDLLNKCTQGERLIFTINDANMSGNMIYVYGEIKKASLEDIKKINKGVAA